MSDDHKRAKAFADTVVLAISAALDNGYKQAEIITGLGQATAALISFGIDKDTARKVAGHFCDAMRAAVEVNREWTPPTDTEGSTVR